MRALNLPFPIISDYCLQGVHPDDFTTLACLARQWHWALLSKSFHVRFALTWFALVRRFSRCYFRTNSSSRYLEHALVLLHVTCWGLGLSGIFVLKLHWRPVLLKSGDLIFEWKQSTWWLRARNFSLISAAFYDLLILLAPEMSHGRKTMSVMGLHSACHARCAFSGVMWG